MRHLIDAFEEWRRTSRPLALATVVDTAGSTYSKAGNQMLIDANGRYRGLLSGGCLESDLADHARRVIASGAATLIRYDMRDRGADEIWGLGLGCDGVMEVLLQRLTPEDAYQPFAALVDTVHQRERAVLALVVDSGHESIPAGASLLVGPDAARMFGIPEVAAGALSGAARALLDAPVHHNTHTIDGASLSVLYVPAPLPPRVLVCGAGPDVAPLLRLGRLLGWHMTVSDHRPAYLEALADLADRSIEAQVGHFAGAFDPDGYAAAVVMTHHLDSDRAWLQTLAAQPVPFVGLLGPPARRQRLLAELGEAAESLAGRLYGPVGLNLGETGPHGISLSVAAQIAAVLHGRDGRPLDRG